MSFWRPGEIKPKAENVAPASATKTTPSPTSSPKAKSRLSDNVMSMKFMKRSLERGAKDEGGDEDHDTNKRYRLIDESLSTSVGAESLRFKDTKSPTIAYPGRRSFGGFNKVVERQYASILEGQRLDYKYNQKTSTDESDIDDDELIRRYAAMRQIKLDSNASGKKKKKKKKTERAKNESK